MSEERESSLLQTQPGDGARELSKRSRKDGWLVRTVNLDLGNQHARILQRARPL
jgi:hypothetical protein